MVQTKVKGSLRDVGETSMACDTDTRALFRELANKEGLTLNRYLQKLSIELSDGEQLELPGTPSPVVVASKADVSEIKSSITNLADTLRVIVGFLEGLHKDERA